MNKTWQVVLAFLVVFVAGGAIGSVFTLRYVPKAGPEQRLPRPEQFSPSLMRKFSNQLGLTAAQKEKIRPVISDAAEDLRRLRNEGVHSGQLILEHMQDEIASVLTPAQRNRFDELIERQREQMRKFSLHQQEEAIRQQPSH